MSALEITEHRQRRSLIQEAHARPFEPLTAPLRVSHLALISGEGREKLDQSVLFELCSLYHVTPPPHEVVFFSSELEPDKLRIRWERHTEFSTYSFYQFGSFADPFVTSPIEFLPKDWLARLPGELLVASHVVVEARTYHTSQDRREVIAAFDSDDLAGASVAGGVARAYSDFQIGTDGFTRFMVYDYGMQPHQAGRLVQRLLEIETYRSMALLALPIARQTGPQITLKDRKLAMIAGSLAENHDSSENSGIIHESVLLDQLTRLAAEIEESTANSEYRFAAAMAYHKLVERRLKELREERLESLQTFTDFMERHMSPAMQTCQSVAYRLTELSARVSRVSQLLRARVDVALEQQNGALLTSMNQRAALQFRLQETVEGLSVVAITYYMVGLIGYGAKAIQFWVPLSPVLLTAGAVPVVALIVWIGIRRIRLLVVKESLKYRS